MRWRMATVREEAIKTVSESRTMLLTSRVRRQRYTTLLAASTPPMASAIVIVVIEVRGPSSSSRAIIIIRIWIRDCLLWKLEHTARADILTRIRVCYGVGNRRQLVSGIAFSPRKLRCRVAMKMMFMSGRYVIFSFSCRRVR